MKVDHDSAQVRLPPLVIGIAWMSLGAILHLRFPIHLVLPCLQLILAGFFIVTGVTINLFSARLFKKFQTNMRPWRTTSRLITTGIYKYSRNPIYLSLVLINVGIACAVNSLWVLLMTLPFIGSIRKYLIAREEKYLEQKFGDEYRAYRKRVRRWI